MAPGPEAQLTRSRRFRRNTESLKVCPGLGQIVKLRRTLNPISKWQVLHPDPGLLLAPYVHSLRAARVREFRLPFSCLVLLHKPIHCFRTGGCVEAQFDDALRVQGCFRNGSAWGSLSMPFVTPLAWFPQDTKSQGCGICLLETTRALTICPCTARYTEFELHNKL